ncbi:MAG: 50S ribosomal protein L10 [Candidatus Aenigmatarchaeota archaeon]
MVKEEKIKKVKELKMMIEEFPVIGIVDLHKFPSKELQEIRKIIRDIGIIKATKKSTLLFAIREAKKENIGELEKFIPNQVAVVLIRGDAFKSYSKLTSLKFETFAKESEIAPNDIIIPSGPTSLLAGPVIGELTKAGIPAGVEEGRITIKKTVTLVKKGEVISKEVANALRKLDIKPISISLNVVCFYEGGKIYPRETLELVKTFPEKLITAHQCAINLSLNISYPTKEIIKILLAKAFYTAKAIERMGRCELMEYVYSVLLLHKAKQPITEENVKKVLEAAGVSVDEAKVKALIASLEGVNIDEAIQQAAMPVATPTIIEKERKEEEEKERKEEEAAAGLSALFG